MALPTSSYGRKTIPKGTAQRKRGGRCALTPRCTHGVVVLSIGIAMAVLCWEALHLGSNLEIMVMEQQLIATANEGRIAALEGIKRLQSAAGSGDGPTGRRDHLVPIVEQRAQQSEEHLPGSCGTFDHSVRRPRHGCQVNKDTETVFCNFENLRVDPRKIHMVARGGEVLSTVMGREESDEFPLYQRGAFSTPVKPHFEVPNEFRQNMHYLGDVLNALRYPTPRNKHRLDLSCKKIYKGTTLFLTRYEYVNLFHTVTDWWNAFLVSSSAQNHRDEKPDRVVFLDGHAEGLLDSTWKSLFGNFRFVKHMDEGSGDGGLCFERAVFVPAGYKSELFNEWRIPRCPSKGMTDAFSEFVLARHGLLQQPEVARGRIVLIDRQPFVSHPRSSTSNFLRQFRASDLDELQRRLERIPGTTVDLVRLETLSVREQLELVRRAHVLVGIHGAGLSHLLFMAESRSHVIEFLPDDQVDFFEYLSRWKGIDYTSIPFLDTLSGGPIDDAVRIVKNYMGTKR